LVLIVSEKVSKCSTYGNMGNKKFAKKYFSHIPSLQLKHTVNIQLSLIYS